MYKQEGELKKMQKRSEYGGELPKTKWEQYSTFQMKTELREVGDCRL